MALRRCVRRGIVGALGVEVVSRVASGVRNGSLELLSSNSGLFSTLCGSRAAGFELLQRNAFRYGLKRTELPPAPGPSGLWRFQKQRGTATGTLSDKWRQTTERMKQVVLEKPRSIVETVKHSEFAEGTRGAVATLSAPVKKSLISYKEAVKLQLEAFWRRNHLIIVGATGLAACLLLWKVMFGIASLFVSLSEGMAKYGFLALAAAMVSFGGMLVKARYTVNPDAVYRIAMRKLNTSADVLKALGAPLSGTDIRAYVMTGGGLRINNFKPRLSSKRCFLIFPIQGSEKRGLVSIETKKKEGQYDFKLLAVDVAGQEGRIYVVGDEAEYKIGGGLIAELRDPIVKAMAAQNEFEAQDDREDKEEQDRKAKESIL